MTILRKLSVLEFLFLGYDFPSESKQFFNQKMKNSQLAKENRKNDSETNLKKKQIFGIIQRNNIVINRNRPLFRYKLVSFILPRFEKFIWERRKKTKF